MNLAIKTVNVTDHLRTGEKARDARKTERLSLQQLADKLKCSKAYLSDLELGRRNWTEKLVLNYAAAIASLGGKARKRKKT